MIWEYGDLTILPRSYMYANIVQAEGIHVSPYSVRKALENTCAPIGCLPEDKLSNGHGLLQIDKLDLGLHIEQLHKLFNIFYYLI